MRLSACAMAIGLLASPAFGQARKNAPAFESAEIRPSSHVWNTATQGGLFRSGRYELRQATLMDLIRTAYGVDADTIFGAPPWLEADRFDIAAKAPPSTSQEAARLMLRNLLSERFQLVVHEDRKLLPGFVLARVKGALKLKQAEDPVDPGCRSAQPPKPAPGVPPYIVAYCRGVTMEAFAAHLRALSAEYLTGPVVDSTGLKGAWDFDFQWTPRGPLMGGRGGVSLYDAIDRQLGLRLEARKIPMTVLVVDSANRKPAADPRAAAPRAPEPLEFEVASVRPSRSGEPPTPPPARQFHPGGRLTWRNVPLRDLVRLAWDLDPDPHAVIV